MTSDQFKSLVWDYDLTQNEFKDILSGKKSIGKFNQDWAISRVLENLNYYDAMTLIPLKTLKNRWQTVQTRLFNSTIKKGYEFLLQKYAIPATR